MTSDFYERNNERFLRLLSYYLNVEDTLVESKSVEEVAACGVSREYAVRTLDRVVRCAER